MCMLTNAPPREMVAYSACSDWDGPTWIRVPYFMYQKIMAEAGCLTALGNDTRAPMFMGGNEGFWGGYLCKVGQRCLCRFRQCINGCL